MIITALARGFSVLGDQRYLDAASRSAAFILDKMVAADGQLLRRYRSGEAAIKAFLEDYSYMARGLIELYRATFKSRYLVNAHRLTGKMDELFSRGGGAMQVAAAGEGPAEMPITAEVYDGALPSGVSVAVMNMLQLGRMLRDQDLIEKGEAILKANRDRMERYPTGHAYLLSALEYALSPPEELIVAGPSGSPESMEMAALVRASFRPGLDLLFRPEIIGGKDRDAIFELCPFLLEYSTPERRAAAYYCKDRSCRPPVDNMKDLAGLLGV